MEVPELRAYSSPAHGWSQGPGFARGSLLRVDSTSVPGATISGLMRPCEGPWLEEQAMESMSGPLHWDGTYAPQRSFWEAPTVMTFLALAGLLTPADPSLPAANTMLICSLTSVPGMASRTAASTATVSLS